MAWTTIQQSHQSGTAPPGTWKLVAGRAITLQPREPGVLRIAQGSVWATGDGPHSGPLNDRGDRFLDAGERLAMGPGDRLVIEALASNQPAYFSWEPLSLPRMQALGFASAGVAQPARDLRLALGLGLGAAGRLVVALVGMVWRFVVREHRAYTARALSAHSNASCVHGAMP